MQATGFHLRLEVKPTYGRDPPLEPIEANLAYLPKAASRECCPGDGRMALFGYSQAQENDAERAVRAALAL